MNQPRKSSGGGHRGGGPIQIGSGQKAKNFKGTMNKLIKYLSIYKISFIIVILFSASSAIFGIFGPKILGKVTTKIFEGVMDKSSGIDFSFIYKLLLGLIILYVFSSIFAYIQGYIMTNISMKVSYKMRKDISEKINKMPLSYFDKTSHGEVLSRVTNDVDTVSQTLNQSLSQIITSATTVIGVLVMMLSISPLLTLVSLGIIPISMGLVMLIVKNSQKLFKEQQVIIGHLNGHIEEMFSGHSIIKAFNGESKSIEKFDKFNNQLFSTAWKAQFISGILMPAMNIIGNLGYVAVCIVGGALAAKQKLEVGDVQAFIQYVRSFMQPISQLANTSNILQQTAAAAERVFEFLEEKEEIPDTQNPIKISKVNGNVTFKNVHFGYNSENIIINDFNAHISSGQKVAIVGPTGAGKTTLIKLLMRFYEINSGEILIDGHNIQNFTRNDLRDSFGMVLQDTWLYNDTIMENIRYGNTLASDEEVIAAAKLANVDSFVHMLPGGYQMILNEESSNISNGQKQLITIARAILSNPSILILDEATSSVDTRTELHIQKAMVNLMKDKTSFIIAHRLSTIRDADHILVMNKGDIVEQGNHQTLIAANGFYANLYNSQFEHENE